MNEQGAANGCAISNGPDFDSCCRIWSLYNNACINNTVQNISLGFDEIIDYCSINDVELNATDFQNITYFSYERVLGLGTSNAYIDDISFTYVDELNNSLPSVNFTSSRYDTCTDNFYSINIPFNITVDTYDKNEDTVYYSLQNFQKYEYLDTVKFSRQNCKFPPICYEEPDTSFFRTSNYINRSGDCPLDISFLNLGGLSMLISDNYEEYGLYLSPDNNCNSNFNYRIKNPTEILTFFMNFEDFKTENEEFNLTFWDTKFKNPIAQLNFKINNSRLLYRSWTGASYQLLSNTTTYDSYKLQINDLIAVGYPSQSNFLAINTPSEEITSILYTGNFTQINTDYKANYFSITVADNTELLINKFQINADDYLPNFTTTKPTQFIVNHIGWSTAKLFVSDDVNKPTVYDEYTLNFFVAPTCKYFINEIGNITNPVGFTKDQLRTPARALLQATGFMVLGHDAMPLLWFAFFIFLMIIQFQTFNKFDFTFPLIVSSLAFLVTNIIFGFADWVLFFLFLFVLGIAPTIYRFWTGVTTAGDTPINIKMPRNEPPPKREFFGNIQSKQARTQPFSQAGLNIRQGNRPKSQAGLNIKQGNRPKSQAGFNVKQRNRPKPQAGLNIKQSNRPKSKAGLPIRRGKRSKFFPT